MFSKKAVNLHSRFDVYLVSVKSTVKILPTFVAFLENINFKMKDVTQNLHNSNYNTLETY